MHNTHQKGFTILELVVAVSVFAFLIISVAMLFTNAFTGSKQGLLAVDNIDQARSVTTKFLNELRNATTGVDGSYPLTEATDNEIIFYSKANSVGATTNRIRYFLSGTNLKKGVVVPSGSPQVYNLAQESISTVQTDVTNGSAPIFTYYDDSYNGSGSALSQPVNINSVKFVKINLTILTQIKSQSATTLSISEGVTIRNLKTNLGN